jgi:hypothetical protein
VATEIVELRPDLLPALRRFAEKVWTRPRSDAFYRWRYQSLPLHRAWLAVRDGEVLAMETAFERPYRIGDAIEPVLEVFDWFCLPELRNSGLGVRVMQALMKARPCLLVGGSDDTRGLLPRLKWQIVTEAKRFVLPLGVDRLAAAMRKRVAALPAPLARLGARALLARPGQRPRPRAVPRGGRAIPVATIGDEIQALYRGPIGYAALPLWPPELVRWLLDGHPSLGHFVPLYFAEGERLRGWTLTRIYDTPDGCGAELVECFAPDPSDDLYTWMVSETALRAAAFRPGLLGACTPCAHLKAALARNGFVASGTNPVQLWRPGHPPLTGPVLIGANSGDSSLVPFAERWFDG